jgi:hypothetical protein
MAMIDHDCMNLQCHGSDMHTWGGLVDLSHFWRDGTTCSTPLKLAMAHDVYFTTPLRLM